MKETLLKLIKWYFKYSFPIRRRNAKIDDWMWIFGMKMYEWVIREEMRFWSL